MTTLRLDIQRAARRIGFAAPRDLYAALTVLTSYRTFGTIVYEMVAARELARRKGDSHRVPFLYGPGPVAVTLKPTGRPKREKPRLLGFMAQKRAREAKARRMR
jgi:hypothetical protein